MPSKNARARAARAKPALKAKLLKKPKPALATSAPATAARKPAKRQNSKLASMVAMLRKPDGATIAEMMRATGWQAHSVRGAISGAIKKKLGLTVTSEVTDEERCYRIAAEG
jgi:hypothetical protein